MRKTRNSRGFTMAEMLIVVAIILVLAGVAFIAVQNHQRSMAQLERNTIAKELFIAAQNHLTMAESEGYPVESASGNYFGTVASDATNSDGSTEDTSTSSSEDDAPTESEKKPTNVYYIIGPSSGNILDLMLPFGSIDETVRASGSYLIHYQTNPARVLDVFYVTTSGNPARFNKEGGIGDGDYDDLMEKRESLPTSGYVLGYYGGEIALSNGDIILPPTVEIHNEERLTVTVKDYNIDNDDTALKLIISGETSKAKLAITLTPATISKDNERFSSVNETDSTVYTCILDDVTTAVNGSRYDSNIKDGLHFADLNAYADPSAFAGSDEKILQFWQNEKGETPTFLPGENITVQAVAYSNTALTNIAYSSSRTTSSLFADPGETSTTAMIANFRHLENLDADISNLDKSLGFTGAEQIEDMIWKDEDTLTSDFVQVIKKVKSIEKVNIYKVNDSTGGVDDCFLPVTPSAWVKGSALTEDSVELSKLSYEGNSHTITGVAINGTGDAGLFGALISESSVANLKLIDFNVATSEGNAGALIGKLTQKTTLATNKYNVSNVVAYNTGNGTDVTIKTGNGNAGGLIGQIVGDEDEDATDKTAKAVIQKSAAALIVSATGGNAGGLIGTAAGGTVSGCYAGGHTIDDPKGTGAVVYDSTNYNVTATATTSNGSTIGGVAGGLIGDAGAAEISYSYSTCSATGTTVGGLIGTGSGAIMYSYCSGLVKSIASTPVEGAFAGKYTGTPTVCKYFDIINEREEKDATGNLTGGYTYLPAVSGATAPVTDISALDETAATFNDFSNPGTVGYAWQDAKEYNPTLKAYYGEGTGTARKTKYIMRTIEQLFLLNTNYDEETDLTVQHEDTTGTVKIPADYVIKHYGDWPAPEIFVVNTKTE